MGTAEERAKHFLDKIKKDNGRINAVLHINNNILNEAKALDEKVQKTGKKGRLYGKIIGVKSNINVNGMISNCASKTLENYKAGYDATVIEKIRKEDGLIIGMLNMDEFACGSSGESSAYGFTKNPANEKKIPGGSSSGSAAAVAAGFCDMSLGSDTGGSIRNPACYCGVVGIKPSYGLVSRYGLIDLSMSLDQIGPLAKNVEDCSLLLDVIKGVDEYDSKSFPSAKIELKEINKAKIGILKIKGIDKGIQKIFDEKLKAIKKLGWDVKEVEIDHVDLAVETYYPLAYAEFFSGTRRFDGRRYGHKIEETCGQEVLRRIFGGSEITKAEFEGEYYDKALAVKELIKSQFEEVFKEVDAIITPTSPILPWNLGEGAKMKTEEIYASDILTIPANLAEICAISLPMGELDKTPVGIQVMAGKGEESKMLSIAKHIEKLIKNGTN